MSDEEVPSEPADDRRGSSAPVQPGSALLPGRADSTTVLLLWASRRAFWPLLLFGVAAAVAFGDLEEGSALELTTPGELLRALLSPLAGVAVAVLLRIAVAWLALLAAWPLSRWIRPEGPRPWRQVYRDWIDRWRLAQAYRSLRWTWGVREEATARLGLLGRRLALAGPLATAATIIAAMAVVAVIVLQPAPQV